MEIAGNTRPSVTWPRSIPTSTSMATRGSFEFYRSVFGGEFSRILYLKELAGPDVPIADEDADKLLHIALPVGTGMLIGNDVPSFLGRVNEQENRSKISVRAGSRGESGPLVSRTIPGGTVRRHRSAKVPGELISVCSGISTALNGSWRRTAKQVTAGVSQPD